MSDSADGYGDRTIGERLARATDEPDYSSDLECLVVRYRNRPDRCTITPRECSETERPTHWLSAETSAVVDLETVR